MRPGPRKPLPSSRANGSAARRKARGCAGCRCRRASIRERLAEITAEPRRYGFHGTLKPPMALIDEVSEPTSSPRSVASRRASAPSTRRRSRSPNCRVSWPWCRRAARPELQDLADHCVIEFDEFRRPADEDELARRRAAGLSPRQDELLLRWGYPYVLEEWRFHLTLTGRLADAAERTVVMTILRQRFSASDRPSPAGARSLRLPPGRRPTGLSPCWSASGSASDGRRRLKSGDQADEGLRRRLQGAVVQDRHQAPVRHVVGLAALQARGGGARRLPGRAWRGARPAARADAVISTGWVSSSIPPSFRKCSRDPDTTTVSPALRQA